MPHSDGSAVNRTARVPTQELVDLAVGATLRTGLVIAYSGTLLG